MKRPVVIEAEQWFPGKFVDGVLQPDSNSDTQFEPHVITLEGPLNVSPGDWIVTGVTGEKYPVKDDIFKKTYESVETTKDERSVPPPFGSDIHSISVL